MSDSSEAKLWLQYARENFQMAEMAMNSRLLNPALQNAQQAVEKALKAVRVEARLPMMRTHSIRDLNRGLLVGAIHVGLTETDCELMDSIFVGSKYPPESALPHNMPDDAICHHCIAVAGRVIAAAGMLIDSGSIK
jgi:HEPN domain-containing protein